MKNINEKELNKATSLIAQALKVLGVPDEFFTDSSTKDTPNRVAKYLYKDVFSKDKDIDKEIDSIIKVFTQEGIQPSPLPIAIKDIEFHSYCEHHLLPYMGKVNIYYAPSSSILGLSKFNRIVEIVAKRPTLQEGLTRDIALQINRVVECNFILVEVEALHTCVACRGVESKSTTKTQYIINNTNLSLAEIINLIK